MALLEAELQDRGTEHLEVQALYEIAQLIGSALNLDKALSEILRILHDTLKMERATLVLPDSDLSRLSIRASYGLTEEEARRGVYRPDEGIIGTVFRTGYPFAVPDVNKEPLFLNRTESRSLLPKGEVSFLGVPVILLEKPVGVLTVDRLFGSEVSFEEDIRFLTVVAMLIGQFLNLHEAIATRQKLLVEENTYLKEELRTRFSHHNIIGQSKIMQEVFRYIEKVAPSRATTLLLGESGTGKELVARAIHQASPRKEKPFIKVNCAALPDNLLESELLGHEKGAFTGAATIKIGRFELADGGTLFLDEIGELPLPLQAKLLRVLQEKQFERLGGTRTINVDVRIIAATNRSLEQEVARKTFREDLFYRLNVVPIVLPALRERREDILLLLDHFIEESNRINDRKVKFSKQTIDVLVRYPWPGNVRELQNLVERLVIMADNKPVAPDALPSYMLEETFSEKSLPPNLPTEPVGPAPAPQENRPPRLEDLEKQEVEAALKRHGWVRARAARELGITQRQIGYRIKKYDLEPPTYG
ncbi:MAG: nif-specific transcriptional activator NifA [Proteobacteria bacterium]|nr:nif-specific transcriptional activator NifA [Pseudomonadota bacterium]MBU1738165.1 nif-specific transcriptional activator NifA [Pseudomonadota bacterium]